MARAHARETAARGKRPRTLRERAGAAIVPMVAMLMLVLLAMAGLAVDSSGAWRVRSAQQQTLELCKDSALASLNLLKYTDTPADATAQLIRDELAAEGFTGTATIYYKELTEAETKASSNTALAQQNRVAGVYVKLEGTYRPVLSGTFGASSMGIGSELAWYTNPYSDTVVWRPTTLKNKKYVLKYENGQETSKNVTTLSSTDSPAALASAIEDGLARVRGGSN